MEKVLVAVNGSLMRGFALNENLQSVSAKFIREATTSSHYRMWSINDQYPAMQRIASGGKNLEVELWELTPNALKSVLEMEPPGLCLGKIELADSQWVFGILGENYICQGTQEITEWGGWRGYISQKFE
jgi:gamma-glutamylcyclotransferase (GGCT)/AIG2-like uncharacterized protein YtfP